jgi:hypothetical protein
MTTQASAMDLQTALNSFFIKFISFSEKSGVFYISLSIALRSDQASVPGDAAAGSDGVYTSGGL